MRYEVYGATNKFGALIEVGAVYSHAAAFRLIESEINPTVYPRFVILQTPRKNAVPIGVESGKVKDGFSTVSRATYVYDGTPPGKAKILTRDYLRDMNKTS